MIEKLIDFICRGFGVLMVLCLGLMVLMVFGNVVLRYGFNSGITVSEELSRWLFVWMTFLGAVVGVIQHAHLGTDALISRLPLAGRKMCFLASHLLMLGVCWLMFDGALQQTRINMQSTSAVMEASMAWLYAPGMVFAVLAALALAHELWKFFTGQLTGSALIHVRESDDMPHGVVPGDDNTRQQRQEQA
ncbi:C4-dicarboxylate ABC transporter permease [Hylemonella gracilis str. Niagara R]|uniref:TRAP transporter small permease protein n=1 Tax=Hylemonella gracilis str. Niagara R TaxID=1458275 RepID=A0A016XG84_9BURK|nr:TRAP transporter small permease [Hylemonella gracilis]EYC51079.1 C4-dicarboxylate ABC transporter permease [Hylemonella gracilis str. Niagara R]